MKTLMKPNSTIEVAPKIFLVLNYLSSRPEREGDRSTVSAHCGRMGIHGEFGISVTRGENSRAEKNKLALPARRI